LDFGTWKNWVSAMDNNEPTMPQYEFSADEERQMRTQRRLDSMTPYTSLAKKVLRVIKPSDQNQQQ
jgi:hypothetical protein